MNENITTAVLFELALHLSSLCGCSNTNTHSHTLLTIGQHQRSQAPKMEAKIIIFSMCGNVKICSCSRLGLGRGLQAELRSGDLQPSVELFQLSGLNSHGCLLLPLSSSQLPSQLVRGPAGSKGRRSNGDGQEGKPRKRRSEAKVCQALLFIIRLWLHSRSVLTLNESCFLKGLSECW